MSSLLTLRLPKVPTRGSGGSWSRNAELSSLLLELGLRASKVSTVTGIGGGLREERREERERRGERSEERREELI